LYRRIALLSAVALAAPLMVQAALAAQDAPAGAAPGSASTPWYRVKAITLTTRVAPEGSLGSSTCVVDADLYTPVRADRRHPVPAIITTNSYGGSKADLVGIGRAYSAKGYVVLAYSGLGFGSDPQAKRRGSDCKITFDDREHDGAAARQLVDFLGGLRPADDGTRVDYVRKDAVAHDGRHHAGDPRVGMLGGSYAGQVQFAAAALDPRIDTIVPLVTWNDLAYSLSPNNTTLAPGTVSYRVPGTEKVQWNGVFLSLGLKAGALGAASVSTRVGPCPNFSDPVCSAFSTMGALGYADAAAQATVRNASVTSYIRRVRVPVLLGQGETDTLFPLREAIATYQALRAQRTPVKLIWQQWGHGAVAKPGEFNLGRPDGTYQGRMIRDWLRYWLYDYGRRPALDFTYYAPWRDSGDAATGFVTAPSYPLPGATTLWVSGTSLHPTREALAPGALTMVAPASAPLSTGEAAPVTETTWLPDVPAATAVISSKPLRRAVDVVGAPSALLRLSSRTASSARPESMLVAFVKLYDVAPDGTVDEATRLVAPIRVADLGKPVEVALPAMVHRFAAGHRMQLVVSLTDVAYKGNAQAQVVTLSTSPSAPTTLTLPGRIDLSAFPTG
jgi:ABC-2 type transport system ATP-binding protein